MSEEEKSAKRPSEPDPAAQQGASAAGATGTGPPPSVAEESSKSPEEIRHDIEQTREELGDTVDALSQKTDVKAQVSKTVDETKQRLRDKQEEIKEKVSGAGGGAGGDAAGQARSVLDQLAERARAEPLPYLACALAAGVLVGMLLRRRRYGEPRR